MEAKYLVCVTEVNNNKYYRMIPDEDGRGWTAEYGRIGASKQTAHYPESSFNTKYREKIRKGYVDQTDLHISTKKIVTKQADEGFAPITDEQVAEIVEMMIKWARKTIAENYTVSYRDVTKKAVDKAQDVLNDMANINNVKEFNAKLLEVFNIIPRRMDDVTNYLAYSSSDFADILVTEQSLLDTMASQVPDDTEIEEQTEDAPKKRGRKTKKTILDQNNLEIYPCTPEQTENIKKHLDHRTRDKFVRAWRVKNTKTFKAFEKYCKDKEIDADGIKFYYHGSRNENDWGIVKEGLKLRPSQSVVRTGAMFGHGHYFASVADKSVGYTSLNNSYWAHGSSNTSLLFVFRVAQGKAYNLHDYSPTVSSWHEKDCVKAGYNSVYAHAGKALRRDEIIVYNDSACTIEYIIELKG